MKKLLTLSALSVFMLAMAGHVQAEGKGHGFEKMDTNGDGVVSKAEFLQKSEDRFAKLDADGDGSVTQDEMKTAKEAMREKFKEYRQKHKDHKDQ